jgi:sugar-specific transcriptional regulator TrmB
LEVCYSICVMQTVNLENLRKLGLQPNEAAIYLALLELGSGTVTEISHKAALNRTTGYDVLERLCLHGIASRVTTGKKKVYTAESPARLRQFLENKKQVAERRLEDLKTLLPDLQSLYKTELKPTIKFAEGKEQMEKIYNDALETKGPIYSILNLKNYAEFFDETGAKQSAERAKRGIKEKVLSIKNNTALAWHEKTYKGKKKLQAHTEYKWIEQKKEHSTAGEVNIFDDKVIIMLSRPDENAAFEIQSQTFADFLKIVFERAWN